MSRRRVFFACQPDIEARRHLSRWNSVQGGRPVPAANLHLTLVFLGGVEEATGVCLQASTREVAFVPFLLRLTENQYWRGPGILCAVPERVPEALTDLVAALAAVARGCGLEPESRPYRPHLTLVRKVRAGDAVHPMPPLEWNVSGFGLMESVSTPTGVEYRRLWWRGHD